MNHDKTPDSETDTRAHISRVNELLIDCVKNLLGRAQIHDRSKLSEPEKSAFDRLKALSLSGMVYGSEEYRACLKAEKPAIEHHYLQNSHHPEHYKTGVEGMTLFDILEMLMDWKAATERMKYGWDIRKSLEHNSTRFNLSPQLAKILLNTIEECGW